MISLLPKSYPTTTPTAPSAAQKSLIGDPRTGMFKTACSFCLRRLFPENPIDKALRRPQTQKNCIGRFLAFGFAAGFLQKEQTYGFPRSQVRVFRSGSFFEGVEGFDGMPDCDRSEGWCNVCLAMSRESCSSLCSGDTFQRENDLEATFKLLGYPVWLEGALLFLTYHIPFLSIEIWYVLSERSTVLLPCDFFQQYREAVEACNFSNYPWHNGMFLSFPISRV